MTSLEKWDEQRKQQNKSEHKFNFANCGAPDMPDANGVTRGLSQGGGRKT